MLAPLPFSDPSAGAELAPPFFASRLAPSAFAFRRALLRPPLRFAAPCSARLCLSPRLAPPPLRFAAPCSCVGASLQRALPICRPERTDRSAFLQRVARFQAPRQGTTAPPLQLFQFTFSIFHFPNTISQTSRHTPSAKSSQGSAQSSPPRSDSAANHQRRNRTAAPDRSGQAYLDGKNVDGKTGRQHEAFA
jgi:hypothetical protein